ncbi:MAG: hypothetical protein HQ503_18640 [Rhodospirillales bacterium]|nr:hypothetical protein [Rhodospirillales bacterium]
MFGFSPLKLLILGVIIVAVWYGFKMFSRGRSVSEPGEQAKAGQKKNNALDMTACAVCGDFVAPNAKACERDDCPYS